MEASAATDFGSEVYVEKAEFDPAAYAGQFRALMLTNGQFVKSAAPPRLGAMMYIEEEASLALVDQLSAESAISVDGSALEWCKTGFAAAMSKVVKVSAKASDAGMEITPFSSLSDADKAAFRRHFLDEYIELTALLSVSGKPAKTHFEYAPILYHSPAHARALIEENEDLGTGRVKRVFLSFPSNPAGAIDEIREKISIAKGMFPTITDSVITHTVFSAKDSYQASLKKYAKEHGLAIKPLVEESPDAEDFLQKLRGLVQSKKYNLGHLNPSPEMLERAAKIGKEALAFIDEISGVKDVKKLDPEYALLRDGFRKKMELMVVLANRAWRRGDVGVSPEQASPDFRREVFAQALGDFLVTHAELSSGQVSNHSVEVHPLLYFSTEEVRGMKARNSDLALYCLIPLMMRNPDNPEAAMQKFREKVEKIMEADPRLLRHEAMRMAFSNPRRRIVKTKEKREDLLPPVELLATIRQYLNGDGRLGTKVGRDIAFEIEERRPEQIELFESMNWTFDGLQVPEVQREQLVKKVSDFITASERAYRKKEISTRLRDFDKEQRKELYALIGSDFMQIAQILDVESATEWSRVPVLYIHPDKLRALKADEKYVWLDARAFCTAVQNNPSGIEQSLDRATRLKNDLIKQYPGITDALAKHLAVDAPLSATTRALEHLQKISEREARRFDSRISVPSARRPQQVYRHIRTQFRNKRVAAPDMSDEKLGRQVANIRDRAALWLMRKEPDIDPDSTALNQFVKHVEKYVHASISLGRDQEYPNILDMPASTQNMFIEMMYENQKELNDILTAQRSDQNTGFKVYDFAFFNPASYMQTLWTQYRAYMPEKLITFVALTAPRKPIDRLNSLVEFRAELVRGNPDMPPDEINRQVLAKAREG